MKQTLRITLFVVIFMTTGLFASAQTLHTIVFCNTIDESIGRSMKVELDNVTKQFKMINNLIDYDLDFHTLDGKDCTKENLKSILDEMYVEEDDVILTFYGGHGSHATNNEIDPWPQYCMNTGFENQNNWVPMALLEKWVRAKNPRLAIILSNCCNVVQGATTIKPLWAMGGDYTRLDGKKADNYKKLFSIKGIVMATSSKIPEPSWCNDGCGGLFTCDLVQALDMVGDGSLAADWNAVLKKTYDLCCMRDIVDRNGEHYKQHPYYEVKGRGNGVVPPSVDRDRKDNDPLGQALLDITNKKTNTSFRLAMIPTIVNRHMSGCSKVMTVGTDLETVVDYEDPEVFLRRICLSPYIRQVIVLRTEGNMLIVHEVRN